MTDTAGVDEVKAAITFVDLAGFTALTETHGDIAAADIAGRFVAVTESVLNAGDRMIKALGDAVLLTSADAAAAITLVLRLFGACETDPRFLDLRAGLHYGPVVQRGGDVFGTTVNIAARIAALAGGGQILITRPIADAAPAAGIPVRALGPTMLHNLTSPVELFRLVREDLVDRDVDPVCRMRVNRATAAGCLTYAGVEYLFCSLECAGNSPLSPNVSHPRSDDMPFVGIAGLDRARGGSTTR